MKHCFQRKSASGLGKGTLGAVAVTLGLAACSQQPQTQPPENRSSEASSSRAEEPSAPPESQQAESADHSHGGDKPKEAESSVPPIPKTLPKGFDCSGLTCYRFEASRQALVPLLLAEKAQLVAFGEAHAPASFQGKSTVHRFTHELLPTFADGASHLLLELLNPPREGCQKEKAAAQKESDEVTQGQSTQNQNEYLVLGTEARKLGVVPDILWSTCEDLAFIASPEGGVVAMMETIAKLSEKSLKEQLRTTKKGRPLVLAYGGALHNDVSPREVREKWSYGPAMLEDTKGRYVEIDLIIPELIKDSESWKSFAWYEAYREVDHKSGAVLMKWGEKSYALFLEPGR